MEATSKDGTKIPFFIVHKEGMAHDGNNPYFENTEGGHGSGVTNEQRAKTLAITYAYLWHQLGGD